eukprot:359192-Chlamydomonas_euryale.AAC.12
MAVLVLVLLLLLLQLGAWQACGTGICSGGGASAAAGADTGVCSGGAASASAAPDRGAARAGDHAGSMGSGHAGATGSGHAEATGSGHATEASGCHAAEADGGDTTTHRKHVRQKRAVNDVRRLRRSMQVLHAGAGGLRVVLFLSIVDICASAPPSAQRPFLCTPRMCDQARNGVCVGGSTHTGHLNGVTPGTTTALARPSLSMLRRVLCAASFPSEKQVCRQISAYRGSSASDHDPCSLSRLLPPHQPASWPLPPPRPAASSRPWQAAPT